MTTEVSPGRVVGGRALVSYKVGGREYPLKTTRKCKVCMSPHRFDIEEALVAGRTYGKIAESLPEDSEISLRNVKDHYLNGHLPLEVSTTRQIVEDRARQVGKSIENSAESLIDGMTLASVVVQKAFERLANGEMQVELKDGLAAAKFLADMGTYDEGGMDQTAIVEAFMVYHENAQAFMSPEQFEAFGHALAGNPVLQALARKYEGQPQVVEGDVVGKASEGNLTVD